MGPVTGRRWGVRPGRRRPSKRSRSPSTTARSLRPSSTGRSSAEDQASPSLDAVRDRAHRVEPTPHAGAHFVRALKPRPTAGCSTPRPTSPPRSTPIPTTPRPSTSWPASPPIGATSIRAVALYRRVGPGAQAEVGFLGSLVPDYSGVGRNEPCPCGSGRKFKQCHLGSSEVPRRPGRALAVPEGARLRLPPAVRLDPHRAGHRGPRRGAAAADRGRRARAARPRLRRFENEPFILDLAVFESGIIDRFADERAVLLPAGRGRDAAGAGSPPGAGSGRSPRSRPVATSCSATSSPATTVTVVEKVASKSVRPGELLLARIVSVQGTTQLIGQPVSVGATSGESDDRRHRVEPRRRRLGQLVRPAPGAAAPPATRRTSRS